MKSIKLKSILLLVIAFMLFLTGCKVDKTVELVNFTDKDGIQYQEFDNDIKFVDLNDLIIINDTSKVNFYKNEDHSLELTDTNVELQEGNNFVYTVVTFKDKSVLEYTFNLYRLKMFTVHFETNCKMKLKDQLVQENSLIEKPTTKLVKYGYGFKGWNYNFLRPVTKDLVIEARWQANSFTITYDSKGGEMTETETYVTFGEPYHLETPTKEGYDFMGWYYNGKLVEGELWNLDGDITIEAKWEEETITYEIDYIIVGCIGTNLQRTYTNKEEVVLRTPYKCGYKFKGWYFTGDFSSERIYVLPKGTTGNLTLYSRWEWFPLENAKISFLGDSISTFYDKSSDINSSYHEKDEFYYPVYSQDVKSVKDTWWYQVVEQTKTKLLVNDSLSGSSVYNNGSEECTPQASMNNARINNLKGSDIVIINMGTNDNVNGHSMANFKESYDIMIKRIKEVCPDLFIFCCTLGYTNYKGYNYTESRRVEMNRIIKEVAKNNDCPLIEFDTIQTPTTYKDMLDNIHPNKKGMKDLATFAVKTMKEYLGSIN